MQFAPKRKLSYYDLLDQVLSVMNTWQDNDLTEHIGTVYVKNYTKLLGLIRPGVVINKKQIE